MANLYVAEATVNERLGSRKLSLLDRDNDGSVDTTLLASIIESAGRTINTQLAQRFPVPFAQITDTPATPETIQELALRLTLWEIYTWAVPDAGNAKLNRDLADATLQKLLEGDYDVEGLTRIAAHKGRRIVVATYEDPVYAGIDSSSTERLKGV